MHCMGIDTPPIAFKMETLALADTPFYSSSKTVKTNRIYFLFSYPSLYGQLHISVFLPH